MYKKLIPSLALLLSCLLTMAQTESDMVFLKDGSLLRGTIIELKANEMVKVKTVEGEIRTLPMEEVKRTRIDGNYSRHRGKHVYTPHTGYFNSTGINLLLGPYSYYNDQVNVGFATVNGYEHKGKWQVGLGVGLDFFRERSYFPLTAEFRYFLRGRDVSPYVGAMAGYALTRKKDNYRGWYGGFQPEHKGGPTAGFELGLRNMTKGNLGYYVSAGYRYQRLASNDYEYWSLIDQLTYEVEEVQQIHRLILKFGITFN